MHEAEWFSLEGGRRLGPFTRRQLLESLAQRAPDTLVWRPGMADWMRAQDVPELAQRDDFIAAFQALAHASGGTARANGNALAFETTHASRSRSNAGPAASAAT